MKSIENIIRIALSTFLAGALLAACQEEEAPVAKAVLGTESTLTFSASNPVPKTITVYSDGPWHSTAPSWISVDPATGSGVTEVTVTAESNTDASGMLEPRKDTLIFSGNTLASRLIVIVSQEGDAYRNASHITLSEVTALTDGKAFVVDEATVAYLSAKGCVLTDGSVFVYVPTVSGIALGDKVSVKGYKGSVNGVPAITQVDEIKNLSAGTYTLPAAKDITSSLATFNGASIEYVTVSGVVSGGSLAVESEGVTYQIKTIDAPSALSLSALNGHKAQISGFSCGVLGANQYGIIPAVLTDKGLDQLVYFEDDFEWLEPWTSASSAGDAVGTNNPSTTAPNVFGTAFAEFLTEFAGRGYGYFEGKKDSPWTEVTDPAAAVGKVLYLQKNYLKFGKSDWNAGITLPAMATIEGTVDVTIDFDWCWQVTGGFKPDIMTLTVEIVGNGVCADNNDAISPEIESAQSTVDGESKIEWQHASLRLNGVDKNTRIKLRPTNYDPYLSNSARGQNRWYLDNIRIVPASGSGGGGGDTGAKSFGATWSFDAEKTFEKDVDYSMNIKTGSWLKSDDGTALLTVNRLSENDGSKICTFTTDATWGETCYRFLSYSVYLNDYWMFEVPAPQHPAGKVRVNFSMSSSAAGPKVFVMEYSTDKENWTPFNVKSGSLTVSGEEPHDVSYTYLISPTYTAANERMEINETFDLPASAADGTLYVRARVNDTSVNDLSKCLNGESHGGTNRIGKAASVTFTAN